MQRDESVLHIPADIVYFENSLDTIVYLQAYQLAKTANLESLHLPPREIFAKMCNCSVSSLKTSFKRLNESGWLRTVTLPGRTSRRFVILKIIRLDQAWNVAVIDNGEIVNKKNWKASAMKPVNEIQYNPGPELLKIHTGCRNADQYNQRLSDLSITELWETAGRPNDDDMILAFTECEGYQPKTKKISNIRALFLSRFISGRINPNRKNSIIIKKQKKFRVDIQANQNVSPASVDMLCFSLLDSGSVPLADLPKILNQTIFDNGTTTQNVDGKPHVTLRELFTLFRVAPGQWQIVPITTNEKKTV